MLTKESQDLANLFANIMLFFSALCPGNLDARFMKAATTQMSARAFLFIRVFFTFGSEVRFTEHADFPKQCFICG